VTPRLRFLAAPILLGALLASGCGTSANPTSARSAAGKDTAQAKQASGAQLVRVAGNLDDALYVTPAPGDSSRLFVVRQGGRIEVLTKGTRRARPLIDVSSRITAGGEQGLLGLAFHPGYAKNGRFFVDYTNTSGDTRVVEFRANPKTAVAKPASARVVLKVDQPFANHNGGMVTFGPDGKLYVGLGDGGGGGDPLASGQRVDTLLGKILRLDVDGRRPYAIPADNPFRGQAGARGEIWTYGARNPWRFSFDRASGDLWIGDVGQGDIEEIDRIPAKTGGVNLGWNAFEGSRSFGGKAKGATPTPPVAEYTHDDGVSVTGGYVYRGSRVPYLAGRYVYADYSSGRIWSMRAGDSPGDVRDETGNLGTKLSGISSFGEGTTGELYVIGNGALYRFAPR
jgi:glucose/arabinose dehydrogenase